jgi:hypothetical protein
MRTVLGRSAGRAALIFVSAGVVGSAALPAVPAAAATSHQAQVSVHHHKQSDVQIGTAVKYVRDSKGHVHRVR